MRNHEPEGRQRASSDRSTFNQENATSRRERKSAERKEKRDKGRKAKKAAAAALRLNPLTDAGGGGTPKPPAPHGAPRHEFRRTDKNGNPVSKADLKKQSCFLSIFGACPRNAADCDRTHRSKEHLTAAEKPDYEAWAKARNARVGQRDSKGGESGGKGGKGKNKGKGKGKGKGKKGGKGGGKGAKGGGKGGKNPKNDGICNGWKNSGVCDKGKDCTYSHPEAFKGKKAAAAAYKACAALYLEVEEQEEEPTYTDQEWAEWEAVDCEWTEVDYPADEEYENASNYEDMDP